DGDQYEWRCLDGEFVQRPNLHQRLYEIIVEGRCWVLTEGCKEDRPCDDGQPKCNEWRQGTESPGLLRAFDEFEAHQAASPLDSVAVCEPPIKRPMRSSVISAAGSGEESWPSCMTAMRSDTSYNSSRSWLITSTAEPARARSMSACRIRAAAPASTPQVGWFTMITDGWRSSSRPMMNFCRLPPDRDAASGSSALLRTSISETIRLEASAIAEVRTMPNLPRNAFVSVLKRDNKRFSD